MISILIFGALGGIARGLVGFVKYYLSYKSITFNWYYFGLTVGISALVGVGTVWAIASSGITFSEGVPINPAMALIIGYAGGDALENLYKILLKKPQLAPFSSLFSK